MLPAAPEYLMVIVSWRFGIGKSDDIGETAESRDNDTNTFSRDSINIGNDGDGRSGL